MKPSDTKIAFVGLGLMGVPMAKNLLKAGFQIAGFDLNKEVAEKFSGEKGFHFVSSPEQAIQNAAVAMATSEAAAAGDRAQQQAVSVAAGWLCHGLDSSYCPVYRPISHGH
jgi:3-hydroxyisobutyrate dehydrogenase-like beta-hydroxyacid dehydrogenase